MLMHVSHTRVDGGPLFGSKTVSLKSCLASDKVDGRCICAQQNPCYPDTHTCLLARYTSADTESTNAQLKTKQAWASHNGCDEQFQTTSGLEAKLSRNGLFHGVDWLALAWHLGSDLVKFLHVMIWVQEAACAH